MIGGNKVTPSVVAYTDNEILVGEGAVESQLTLPPANVIYGIS